jgi:hypothetical protein
MLLKFPNLETLRQAITRQAVPSPVVPTAVQAAFDDQDQVWVETPAAFNRAAQGELRKLSVQLPKNCSLKLKSYSSWTELAQSQRYLRFDDLQTFRLALTSKAVPREVSQTPITAGFDDQDRLWIETPANVGYTTMRELRKLGAHHGPRCEAKVLAGVTCWPELLPLVADPNSTEHLEQTPVLFDLPTGERLAHLASEILRLGNDRQTFRWVEEEGETEDSTRGLLRVVGPPYYSLLRAIDRHPNASSDGEAAPVAFIERAPRVWVELGYTHPLIDQIKLPPGKVLLVRPPRLWTLLEDAPFRDIYEVMEFALPDLPVSWQESELPERIKVGLSLRAGGPTEGGEMWVLRDKPVEELNKFVQNADDQMLHRLAFAVGDHEDQTTIIVRVRQSKLPPPVLVLNAVAYRSYQKMPNLFLPCGTRLHPPLRRDQVRKLLADDAGQVVWLMPQDNGSFTPQQLPEDSFRPLWDWTDYILDHEKEALQAWVQAAQFDFEGFICDEEPQSKPKKGNNSDRPRGGKSRDQGQDIEFGDTANFTAPPRKDKSEDRSADEEEEILDAIPVDQDRLKLQQERSALEERFQSYEGGLDIPERQAMWPDLARLNAILGNHDDSGVCWLNALWAQDTLSPAWSWEWFRTEAHGCPAPSKAQPGRPRDQSWASRLSIAGQREREVRGSELDWLLANPEPSSADLRALAALIVSSARRSPAPQALLERLNPIQRYLETHERLLPVRAVWLTWVSLIGLSRGDVLALARARDRLLERLFQNGLRPEQDLPSFLRFSGQPTSQRFRAVRQWLTQLAEMARRWTHEAGQAAPPSSGKAGTAEAQTPMDGYIDLVFSFGLARLGESDASRELLTQAQEVLGPLDDVHTFLLGAFQYRITQALEGKPHTGPLPNEYLEMLEAMDRMPRYVVDRLRQHSRILEPNQRIDPYRHWSMRMSELDRELAELVDINDRKEVINRVQRLLRDLPKGNKGCEDRSRILRSALDLAPRISEEFAQEMLEQVMPTYDSLPEPREPMVLMERAAFLEKGLTVAAHFDRLDHIQPLVRRFQGLLQSQKGDRAIQAMESLAGQCFRGLRKLGMREEIDQMLTLMERVILEGRDIQHLDTKLPNIPASLRALLHVAGGWFYFGRDRQAEPILQAVRGLLYREELAYREKTALACVYAGTVGQASVEVAQKRLEEVFQKLTGIRDTYTTNNYYSLSQLDVVEAVVLAVASDDFTMGTQARRWLDDDEFIVRRRIHRDMKQVMAQH